jgi:hypothetical protein
MQLGAGEPPHYAGFRSRSVAADQLESEIRWTKFIDEKSIRPE